VADKKYATLTFELKKSITHFAQTNIIQISKIGKYGFPSDEK
jgi:hypothetical protein